VQAAGALGLEVLLRLNDIRVHACAHACSILPSTNRPNSSQQGCGKAAFSSSSCYKPSHSCLRAPWRRQCHAQFGQLLNAVLSITDIFSRRSITKEAGAFRHRALTGAPTHLREHGLIDLVVAVLAVAHQVHHHIRLPRLRQREQRPTKRH